ncbi:MAG: ATP-binding protein [Phormidesmis sp.]
MTLEVLLALMVGASVNPVTAAGLIAGGITTVGGGIISNRADAALVWSCGALAKALKKEDAAPMKAVLAKALWLSYLQALESVCTECKAELIGESALTYRGQPNYPPEARADIHWLNQKLDRLSQEMRSIEQGALEQVPDFSWQALEQFTAPISAPVAAKQSIKQMAISALIDAADEPEIIPIYKSKLARTETGLFERACGFFAKRLAEDSALQVFFENHLLMQMSSGMAEQVITLKALQQQLNDLSQTVPQQLNQALATLEAVEAKQDKTQENTGLILAQSREIKRLIETLIVVRLGGEQLSDKADGKPAAIEPDLAKKHTIAPNPFGPLGGRIKNLQQLFGRERLLNRIFEILNSGSNVALIGQGQIGKSSVLEAIQRLAEDRLTGYRQPIYIDLQHVVDEHDFYFALCDQAGIEELKGFRLTRALETKRLLLLLDGLEKMTLDGFTDQVRGHLRGLADGRDAPIKMVVAASESLDQLFIGDGISKMTSPVDGIYLEETIAPWDEPTLRAFIGNRLQTTTIQFSEAEISTIFENSQGHPRQVMIHCYQCYERYRGE